MRLWVVSLSLDPPRDPEGVEGSNQVKGVNGLKTRFFAPLILRRAQDDTAAVTLNEVKGLNRQSRVGTLVSTSIRDKESVEWLIWSLVAPRVASAQPTGFS